MRAGSSAGWSIRLRTQEPFFLFLHYYDPHHHYSPPEPFRSRFSEHPYAGEIAYVDATLAEVIEALRRHDLYDSTLLVVTSDHGEDFGGHDEIGHSWFVYQSTQHVPLVVRAPGMRGARVVSGAVGIVDVVPTLLALLGADAPGELQGRDLSPWLRGRLPPDRDRYVYCESYTPTKLGCSPLLGLVSQRWKYVHTSRPELYDIEADPLERENRLESEPALAAALADRVERVRAESRPGARFLDPGSEKYLLALGYLKGDVDEDAVVDPGLPDAKDEIESFNQLLAIAGHIREKEYGAAKRTASDLLERRPDLIDVHRLLGDIAFQEQEWRTLIVKYELYERLSGAGEGLGLGDDERARRIGDLYQRRGVAWASLGDRERAEADFRRARELHPELPQSHYNLAHLLRDQPGREKEARSLLEEALRVDPDYAPAERALAELDTAD